MAMGSFRIENRPGPVLLRCTALDLGPWRHGFSTRRDGDDDAFDLRPDGEHAASRRAALLSAAGLAGARLVELRQVHGAVVRSASAVRPGAVGDALVVRGDAAGIAVGVRSADCVPVLLADPAGRAAAAVHAGWRGVAAGVVTAAVRALIGRGIDPTGLVAAIGPAIGPCCYPVDADCARRVAAACPDPGDARDPVVLAGCDGPRVDLRAGVRRQLEAAGVEVSRIHVAAWCTRCTPDLLFSHRGQGAAAGRMLAVIGVPAGGRS